MMTPKQKAIADVYEGRLVRCAKEEYPEIRSALQEAAGRWIDAGQTPRAVIALEEVKRLDAIHGNPARREGE